MNNKRQIRHIYPAVPTIEGAGVHLKRVFGHSEVPAFDPFLLLDDFHSDNRDRYIAGFPWHPHRGIETVTYMISGRVEHGDSLGNKGVIEAGDLQWMTAGKGIVHQEMPKDTGTPLWGLQLWVNLPSDHKMTRPRYRDVQASSIPGHREKNGVAVKVISGKYKTIVGPVQDIVCRPECLDIQMPPNTHFEHVIEKSHNVFAYILEGEGYFDTKRSELVRSEHAALYGAGEAVRIETGRDPLRFMLVSGKPIGEPVAWYGPIVMNTEEELSMAFEEYRSGTFLRN